MKSSFALWEEIAAHEDHCYYRCGDIGPGLRMENWRIGSAEPGGGEGDAVCAEVAGPGAVGCAGAFGVDRGGGVSGRMGFVERHGGYKEIGVHGSAGNGWAEGGRDVAGREAERGAEHGVEWSGEKKSHDMANNTWVMPANLKIWTAEAPPQAAVRTKVVTMRWSAVTTLADGQTTWYRNGEIRHKRSKSGLTGQELRREEDNEREWLSSWPEIIPKPAAKGNPAATRWNPEAKKWNWEIRTPEIEHEDRSSWTWRDYRRRDREERLVEILAERQKAAELTRLRAANRRPLEKLAETQLMRVTLKMLAALLNETKRDWMLETGIRHRGVTRKELRAGFRE